MLTILKMNLLQTFSSRRGRWCGRILPPFNDERPRRGASVALSQATVLAGLMRIEGLVKTLPACTGSAGKTILPKWSRQDLCYGWNKQPEETESNVIFVIIQQRRKASYGHGLVTLEGARRRAVGSVESCETV